MTLTNVGETFKKDTHFTDLWFEETYNVHILSWHLG